MRANHIVGKIDWITAYNSCKQYESEGGDAGQWRLPTQRELSMIWILHPQLIGKGDFTVFNTDYYWSSTENTATSAWIVLFTSAYVDAYNKGSKYYFRCVRDL
ncbi:Lcl C-terminal domain-containing protein [Parabacteroides sp.]